MPWHTRASSGDEGVHAGRHSVLPQLRAAIDAHKSRAGTSPKPQYTPSKPWNASCYAIRCSHSTSTCICSCYAIHTPQQEGQAGEALVARPEELLQGAGVQGQQLLVP